MGEVAAHTSRVNDIIRKAQTREPTKNPGHFGSKSNSESAAAPLGSGPLPQRNVIAYDLEAGDVFLGVDGGRVRVLKVEDSKWNPGDVLVFTEYGRLVFDAEQELILAATDEKRVTLTSTTLEQEDADEAIDLIRNKLGYTGTMWTRADVETIIDELVEDGDLENPDYDAIWDTVRWSYGWQNLGDASEGEWDQIRDVIRESVKPNPADNPVIMTLLHEPGTTAEDWLRNLEARGHTLGNEVQLEEARTYFTELL